VGRAVSSRAEKSSPEKVGLSSLTSSWPAARVFKRLHRALPCRRLPTLVRLPSEFSNAFSLSQYASYRHSGDSTRQPSRSLARPRDTASCRRRRRRAVYPRRYPRSPSDQQDGRGTAPWSHSGLRTNSAERPTAHGPSPSLASAASRRIAAWRIVRSLGRCGPNWNRTRQRPADLEARNGQFLLIEERKRPPPLV
jgi:hypothetical protein